MNGQTIKPGWIKVSDTPFNIQATGGNALFAYDLYGKNVMSSSDAGQTWFALGRSVHHPFRKTQFPGF